MTDHIPADKLREIIHSNTFQGEVMEHRRAAIIEELKALIAPPLPTLAELIEAGNEWHKYLRFQCDVGGDRAGVVGIVSKDVFWISYDSGFTIQAVASQITPLPDLPKLEWPAQEPRNPENPPAETLNNASSDTPRNPLPEDVPAEEPWIVEFDGHKWVGVRATDHEIVAWGIIRMDGLHYRYVDDSEIKLTQPLVPEVKP